MEDSKILDISLEDIKILPEINPLLKKLPKLRRQSNNSTCSLTNTLDSNNSENLQSCGSVCVYNLQQQLIFNCEFCDTKYGDLDNFRRHLHQAHNLFQLEEKPVKQNTGKKRQSSEVCTVVKKEPLEPPIDLPSTYFTEPLVSCGAVFIHNQEEFHLACGYCDCCKYDKLDAFEKHVRQQHNILEGAYNELNVVPKVEVKKEEFIITEVVEPTEVKVEKKEPLEVGVIDIKQSYSDEDENEGVDDDDEENELDEDDEEFLDEDDEEFLDDDHEVGEEDETEDEQNTSKATKRKQQESPSDELSSSTSAKRKSNEEIECGICHDRITRGNLNRHNKLHLRESANIFNCQHCNMIFLQNSDLRRHMDIHTGEIPYECDICQILFYQQSSLIRHKKLHLGDKAKRFQCDQCDEQFLQLSKLEAHFRTHTGEKFKLELELDAHKRIHNKEEQFECDVCHERFHEKRILYIHETLKCKVGGRFDCEHCDRKFKRRAHLIQHVRTHTGEKPYECEICHRHLGDAGKTKKCEYCDNAYFSKADLRNHLRKSHAEEESKKAQPYELNESKKAKPLEVKADNRDFNCEYCNKTFKYRARLIAHLRTHTGEKPFECGICQKRFGDHGNFIAHKKRHLGDAGKTQKCDYCDKAYFVNADLRNHIMKNHAKEESEKAPPLELKAENRDFNCEHCNKTFKKHQYLTAHLRTHTGEKPYECEICHKRFGNQENLIVHKKRHLGDAGKTKKCDYCDNAYFSKADLRNHLRKSHAEEESKKAQPYELKESKKAKPLEVKADNRDFNCEYCNKTFKYRARLIAHLRTHTGEKPFECGICQKRFGNHGNFIAHKKRHLGDAGKTQKCDYCDKAYFVNADLRNHIMKFHAKEESKKAQPLELKADYRVFNCEHCKKTFKKHAYLTAHLRTHTGEKPYGFGSQANLIVHKKRHLGDAGKTEKCDYCDKKFITKIELRKHIERNHKEEAKISYNFKIYTEGII